VKVRHKQLTNTQEIGDVASRVLSGSAWVLGVQLFSKGLGAVQLFILARMMGPNDFGLFAIALSMLLAFEVLTRTGFDDALIQKRGNIEDYVHTAFGIQIIRGVVMTALIIFTAPYIASFFNEPAVAPVVSTLALMQLLRGFRSPGIILLQRELNFQLESKLLAVGKIFTIITTLILAFQLRSIWALVYGAVIGEATLVVLSYAIHPYRPKLFFSLGKAKELVKFGIWLFLAGIASYIAMQADNIAVGRLINAEALGVYFIAFRIANFSVEEIAKPLIKTLKPAYAALQDDVEHLRIGLEKTIALFFAIFLPIAIFLMLNAEIVIQVVFGNKWNAIIPILPILVLGALFNGLVGISAAFFIGTGRTRVYFLSEFVRAVTLLLTLYPFFVLAGLTGIAWASAVSTASQFVVTSIILLMRLIQIRSFLVRELLPISFSTLVLGVLLLTESTFLPVALWSLVVTSVSSAVIYAIAMWLLVHETAHLSIGKLLVRKTLNYIRK
jgi:lipopolysaccharide exporter